MDTIIFIIAAIILYPVLRTIFSILLTLYKSDNLKFKVAVLTFLRPLVYTAILGLTFTSTFSNSLLWLFCFVIADIVRDIAFGKDKYLSKLTTTNDHISIEYISSLLQTKYITINLNDRHEFKLSEMRSVANYPPSLTIVDDSNTKRFIIFSKEAWKAAKVSLDAANNSFAKVGLTN
jgi:hypothetical protein